ncbi:MAG: endolytic transglycosylase MltG [Lysobacterales bacterium]
MRALRTLTLLFFVAAFAAGASFWIDYQRFAIAPLTVGVTPRILEVEQGDSFTRVVEKIAASGMTNGHPLYWRLLGWRSRTAQRLQVGEYAIVPGTTPTSLLSQLHLGRVRQYRFTIVEGWNIRELRAALARRSDVAQTLAGMDDASLMQRLERTGIHPEGRFLPETYAFVRGESDVDLLRRAASAMDRELQQAWARRAADLPIDSAEQALVLASVIEKETGVASERRRIAGVFARRLKLGMLLQTDPTVIYGIGVAYAGNITRRHLETDTPYNTYTRAGLPPTPIAMPGAAAIAAAVDPAPGDELYFVARGDGGHEFSATLAQHNAAFARFQLGRR